MSTERGYQFELRRDIQGAWDNGAQNVMGVLPTGGGKTFVFSRIIADHDGPSVAIAHRGELVSQISLALARNDVRHSIVGPSSLVRQCVRGHHEELGRSWYSQRAECAVASVDSLGSRDVGKPTLWVIDECFPAGTLVDGRRIETLRVGDMVTAFNEATGGFEQRAVVRLFRNLAPAHMVRICVSHHVIHCTSGHPFYTQRGWVEAINLTREDYVLVHSMRGGDSADQRSAALRIQEEGENLLQASVRLRASGGASAPARAQWTPRQECSGHGAVPGVFYADRENQGPHLLFADLQQCLPSASVLCDHGGDKSQVRVREDASAESDARCNGSCCSISEAPGDGARTLGEGRERTGGYGCGEDAAGAVRGARLRSATGGTDQARAPKRLPVLLQSGPRSLGVDAGDRGRRAQPPILVAQGAGCEEGRVSRWVRVDSAEVYERNDPSAPGASGCDGHVYNIEVEGLHTYLVGGVVVHNCHHVTKDNKWGKAVAGLAGARGLGLTATPVRADGRGLGRAWDGLMDEMIVGPSPRDLILAGHLSRYHIRVPPSDLDLSAVATGSTGDYVQPQLRAAVARSSITGDVVRDYLRYAAGKRGVTFVPDVDTAAHVAGLYRAAGVPAEAVSAKTPAALRSDLVRRLRDGRLLQLVNVDLFGEGFDLPAIECVSFLRPTQSFALYCQQFGRALRVMEGKTHATIIDHVGNIQRHGLPDAPREWSLERREKRAKSVASAIPLRVCPECSSAYEGYSSECPYCGHVRLPAVRTAPEHVEGDLIELDWDALEALRGAVAHVDGPARVPWGASPVVEGAVRKRHRERQESQTVLREAIAVWAGHQRAAGRPDSESYRRFWHAFGIDVMSAQALGAREAETLAGKVLNALCQ